MLTLEELDILDTTFLLENKCFSSDHCALPIKAYAYFSRGRKTGTIYIECNFHVSCDKNVYLGLEIIELSDKEIFYLKCHANS